MLKSGQSIINNFKSLGSVALFKCIFVLKQYIFRLDVSVHNVSVSQVFDSLQNLFDDSSDLMWLKLFLFFPVLNLLVKCNAFEQFKDKVVLITVFKDFEEPHKVFMFQLAQDFKLVENRFLSIFYCLEPFFFQNFYCMTLAVVFSCALINLRVISLIEVLSFD